MESIQLNLARKWRSKTFDNLIGQELVVKILKNSLYTNYFFPVYLFAGQRGCGKTSTARIFAAAINCEQLSNFQQHPKQYAIPCLTCISCIAMQAAKHPDFIEIDAASHTGVDHVRSIIDAASLLPVMGRKRIYLIDEAHMLSKAAFNALLKMLEEPPASALFILATTDTAKILETVRSRSFQLLFNPVKEGVLRNHLRMICQSERIAVDDHALTCIVQETNGCVRDAINLIEQVRFSTTHITKEHVLSVLGYADDERIIALLTSLVDGNCQHVLEQLTVLAQEHISPERIFKRLVEYVRWCIWLQYGVAITSPFQDQLARIVGRCSPQRLYRLSLGLYHHEELIMRSSLAFGVLEAVLLFLIYSNRDDSQNGNGTPAIAQPVLPELDEHDGEQEEIVQEDDQFKSVSPTSSAWQQFIAGLDSLNDPLIRSIFVQAVFQEHDQSTGRVTIRFDAGLIFFKEWIGDTRQLWLPLLQAVFGQQADLEPLFQGTAPKQELSVATPVQSASAPRVTAEKPNLNNARATSNTKMAPKSNTSTYYTKKTSYAMKQKRHEQILDVSDAARWPKTHQLLRYFPGTVTLYKESTYE